MAAYAEGYPISAARPERSAINGKVYTTQYFERSVFELHPENARPFDVLLSLIGVLAYREKYPNGAPGQRANNDPGYVTFFQTGKHLGGSFLAYFNEHGRLCSKACRSQTSSRRDRTSMENLYSAVLRARSLRMAPEQSRAIQCAAQSARYAQLSEAWQPATPEARDSSRLRPFKDPGWPIASNDYLIWYEGGLSGPHHLPYEFDIQALDLRTNKAPDCKRCTWKPD